MEQLRNRRRAYYAGKYAKEWHVVAAFLLAVAVVILMAP